MNELIGHFKILDSEKNERLDLINVKLKKHKKKLETHSALINKVTLLASETPEL